jgi:hypothetical protein
MQLHEIVPELNPADPGWKAVAFWLMPHGWSGIPAGMHVAARQDDGRWLVTTGASFANWDDLMTWARSASRINLGIHEMMLHPNKTGGMMLDAICPF